MNALSCRSTATSMLKKNCLALLVGIVLSSSVHAQQVSAKTQYAISSGELVQVVNEISRKSGLQIVYDIDSLLGIKADDVKGNLTVQQALDKALKGTNLSWAQVNPTTISIKKKALAPPRPMPSGNSSELPKQENSEIENLPEILVVGKRSINTDIRRTRDDIQPYVVLEREQIESSMATNLEDFLRTRLPMNTAQGTGVQNNPADYFANQSSINLRGLGSDQTLILVNGRRMPSVSGVFFDGNVNQPDINGIPIDAVERIEILPATASGIYGGGATGGVINIILRQDYAGLQIKASYDNSFDTDSAKRRYEINGGLSLNNDWTQILFAAGYSDGNSLLVGDRDFARRGRQLYIDNAYAETLQSMPLGYTANITSLDGPLILRDGTNLGSIYTFVPVGYGGIGTDNGAALVANAGAANLDLPNAIDGKRQSLISAPKVKSFLVSGRQKLSDSAEAYLDISSLENQSTFYNQAVPSYVYMDASSPANPFNNAIYIRSPVPGMEFPAVSLSATNKATLGAVYKLPGQWHISADFNWSRSKFQSRSMDQNALTNDGELALSDGRLEVLRDVNMFPLDYTPYLLPYPQAQYGPSTTTLRELSTRFGGPIFEVPGGQVILSGSLAIRKETADASFSDILLSDGSTRTRYYSERGQEAKSLYLETSVPLISIKNAMALAKSLDFQASVRRDIYDTRSVGFGENIVPDRNTLPALPYTTNGVASTNSTVGFKWVPIEDIAFRASYGTGFLPPSISQIVSSVEFLSTYLADPKRGNVWGLMGPITAIYGGNPNVKPEDSKSLSAGIVTTPRSIPGLRLSVDYTRIEKTNEIAGIDPQEILNFEDEFPGRVVRGPKLPGDPESYAGPVIALDWSLVNIAKSTVEAIDYQADYSWTTADLGAFRAYVIATQQTKLERQALVTSPVYNEVGFENGPLEWRGNGGLSWEKGPWSAIWNTQYYDSYVVSRMQKTFEIPSQTYHDIFFKYRTAYAKTGNMGILADLEIALGLKNVFNKSPPTVATTGTSGGYSTYGDPRLRVYTLSISKHF